MRSARNTSEVNRLNFDQSDESRSDIVWIFVENPRENSIFGTLCNTPRGTWGQSQ